MQITDSIIQIITALIGTFGFGILFNIRDKKILFASLGGMMSWLMFLLLGLAIEGETLRYLIVAICSTAYAEILARKLKTPASTFTIITLIPLVPGSAIYYTTTFALNGNIEAFIPKLIYTAQLAVALSLGIIISTAIFRNIKIRKTKTPN